jgi:hypothetical protein
MITAVTVGACQQPAHHGCTLRHPAAGRPHNRLGAARRRAPATTAAQSSGALLAPCARSTTSCTGPTTSPVSPTLDPTCGSSDPTYGYLYVPPLDATAVAPLTLPVARFAPAAAMPCQQFARTMPRHRSTSHAAAAHTRAPATSSERHAARSATCFLRMLHW